MQNRTTAMVITVATALICGCAAILACSFGIFGVAQIPFDTFVNDVPTGSAPMPSTLGYALLCVSAIFVAIPVVVGFLTLRRKPGAPDISGPIPPPA